jgi:hypothetical protein
MITTNPEGCKNSSKEDEKKKSKGRSTCYNCGKEGHIRPECPKIMKEKERGHHKRSNKSRRAYVAWESESGSSSGESSSSSNESAKMCYMANKGKKKNVSHSKPKFMYDLSYSQLQESFENLQR